MAPISIPPAGETAAECQRLSEQTALASNSTSATPTLRLAFSVKEAAEILGVSEKTIRRLINRRLLRASRALRHLLIPRKEIERFLEETILP